MAAATTALKKMTPPIGVEAREISYGRGPKRISYVPILYRIKYTIGNSYRFASHLDIMRTLYRALRRSNLPVAFSRGFTPLPRVSFGPAKSVGMISRGEYLDIQLTRIHSGNISLELNSILPNDIRAVDVRSISNSSRALDAIINLAQYEIEPGYEVDKNLINNFMDQKNIYFEKERINKRIKINLRRDVFALDYQKPILAVYLHLGSNRSKIFDLIAYLFNLSDDEAKAFMITRADLFVAMNQGETLLSPMEVK